MKAPSAKFAYFLPNKKLKFNRNKEGQTYHKLLLKQPTCALSPRIVWKFNLSDMKGEPVREDKLNFLIRGGLFVYFLPKQKVKEENRSKPQFIEK